MIAVVLLALIFGWPLQNTVRRIITGTPSTAEQLANYLDHKIEGDARILSSQWDVDFYSNRSFVPIPQSYYDYRIAEQAGVKLPKPEPSLIEDLHVNYILDGPELRNVAPFPEGWIEAHNELIVELGEFKLYRVPPYGS